MKKTLAYAALATVMASGMSIGTASAASAAHCVEGSSPGFSYFGQDGRKDGAPKGASACREATGSPAERAPGQSK